MNNSACTLVLSFSEPINNAEIKHYTDFLVLPGFIHVLNSTGTSIEILIKDSQQGLRAVVEKIKTCSGRFNVGNLVSKYNSTEYFLFMVSDRDKLKVDKSGAADAASRAFPL